MVKEGKLGNKKVDDRIQNLMNYLRKWKKIVALARTRIVVLVVCREGSWDR